MSKTKIIPIAILSIASILPVTSNAKPPEQIMRANCGSCHNEDGSGGTSWIDPSQRAFKIAGRSIKSIKKWVREGRQPEMPSFAHQEISDIELDELATYINDLPGSFIPAPVEDYTVTIKDEDPWYDNMQLEITAGETVKFDNQGGTYHPVTQFEFVADRGYEDETIDRGIENDDPDLAPLKGSDSGLLGPNGVYYRTFDKPGVYTFLCKIHPYMRGQVFVNEVATPPTVTLTTPQPLPAVGGVGEIWVEAQFQDRASTSLTSRGQDGVIQVIDTSNWDVINEIEVGNNPHNIWFKSGSNGGSAVITNWFDNYLTEIDAVTKQVITNHIAGAAPAHITSDHAGDKFYVSLEGSNYVQMFNQKNMRLTSQIPVSGSGPHGIWYGGNSDDDSAIIMTSNSLDNTVSFINPAKKEEIITLDAGLYPLGAGVNSTGTRGFAGNCLEGSISVYNLESTPVLTDTLVVGGCPVQAPVSPDDRYVVVPGGPTVVVKINEDNPDKDEEVVASFNTGKGAHGATFTRKADDTGYYAYVTHKKENYVSVIDLPDDGSLPSHAGDVPLNVPNVPQNVSLFGVSLTGGNGIAANPLPAPWQ